jgi:hypothetical protein
MHSRWAAQAGRAKTAARSVRDNADRAPATGLSRAEGVATPSRLKPIRRCRTQAAVTTLWRALTGIGNTESRARSAAAEA